MPECFIESEHIFAGHVSLLSGTYMTFSVLQKLPCIVKFFIDVPKENSSTECQFRVQKYNNIIKLTATYSERSLEENPHSVRYQ